MSAMDREWFAERPKGTLLEVIPREGRAFQLVAEGGAFRDFVLHKGSPALALQGRRARFGGARLFWSGDMLARWIAQGRCSVVVVPTGGVQ